MGDVSADIQYIDKKHMDHMNRWNININKCGIDQNYLITFLEINK